MPLVLWKLVKQENTLCTNRILSGFLMALSFLFPATGTSQEKPAKPDLIVFGKVVDAQGNPVENATVHPQWRANGSCTLRPNGQLFDNPLTDEQVREFWGNVGIMEASAKEPILTAKDGTFSIPVSWRNRTLFAINRERDQGFIVELPTEIENMKADVLMPMTDLVTITGKMKSASDAKQAVWTHVYVESVPHPEKPLAINRLISCGSFECRFEFRLPPGEYQLDAYGSSSLKDDINDLVVNSTPAFKVTAGQKCLDLGTLELAMAPPSHIELSKKSKSEGRWRDYREHYGEPAPPWHSIDGRGIDHQQNIEALRGKWVLLDFWGLSCAPCLKRHIPNLMEFYEKNSEHRSRFEIIGVCIDYTGEIDSMEKLDAELSSIELNVWKGTKIPFPIVLDNTFTTWERYGIPGMGELLLIDPQGNIVKGDEKTLQEILNKEK